MSLNPRVSEIDFLIVKLTYNSEDFIKECLGSIYNVIKNTNFSFEVIEVLKFLFNKVLEKNKED